MESRQIESAETYYTVKDIKEILNMGNTTVYKLVNQPDFPKMKIGKKWLIPKSKFELFMNRWSNKCYEF